MRHLTRATTTLPTKRRRAEPKPRGSTKVIRLFKVYYPLRTLVLLAGEALIAWLSFVLGMKVNQMWNQEDSLLINNQLLIENGYLKILALTGIVLLLSHGFDLYDSSQIGAKLEQTFRLLLVLGLVALGLAGVIYVFPSFLPGKYSAIWGVLILSL